MTPAFHRRAAGVRSPLAIVLTAAALSSPLAAQVTPAGSTTLSAQPVPRIDPAKGLIVAGVAEFASLPDIAGVAARMMLLVNEPGTRRLFVNDMRGPLYSVSYDGKTVTRYLDLNDSTWGVNVQSQGRERGFQSFAFHPQFTRSGSPGYGKLYTFTDSRNNQIPADFRPDTGSNTHHTVLYEWTAKTPSAATYDGGAPREIMRFEKPYSNHNGGMIGFNPLARTGTPEFGLLYIGSADGGSGGDPQNMAQNLASGFGKILRIDPMGRNSANGKYGIPATNPFAGQRASDAPKALPEIFAYGLRNPQRFTWDSKNSNMYVADIGQNIVEKISLVTAGANLGWNIWEGSFGYGVRGVDTTRPRGDPKITFPVVEYAHSDSLLQRLVAVTGVHVFRSTKVRALENKVIFGDNPSGEVFYFDADKVPQGGSADFHRVLFRNGRDAEPTTLLQLIRARNEQQGKTPATRADLRFGAGDDGRLFLLNKADGTIRVLVP